ncbi:MAG: hypothetical protein WBM13_14655 [Bacteroidia bacterium]
MKKHQLFNIISAVLLIVITLWLFLVINDNPITWHFGDNAIYCVPLFFLLSAIFSIRSMRIQSNKIAYLLSFLSTIGFLITLCGVLYIRALADAFQH